MTASVGRGFMISMGTYPPGHGVTRAPATRIGRSNRNPSTNHVPVPSVDEITACTSLNGGIAKVSSKATIGVHHVHGCICRCGSSWSFLSPPLNWRVFFDRSMTPP